MRHLDHLPGILVATSLVAGGATVVENFDKYGATGTPTMHDFSGGWLSNWVATTGNETNVTFPGYEAGAQTTFSNPYFRVKTEADDISSEGALGAPMASAPGLDVFGASLKHVGVSGGSAFSNYDALRISDAPDAYQLVLNGVPELSTQLLTLPALAWAFRRGHLRAA